MIEWTDETWWHEKTAAKRIGVPVDEYVARLSINEKWCTRCKAWHSRFIFLKDASRGDGLAASCRGYRTPPRPATSEEIAERKRRSYREYYAGNGGPRIRSRNYARKRHHAPIPSWWREDLLAFGCAYCDAAATTVDHVIPLSASGPTTPGNLVPACTSCNSQKKASDPQPWIDRMRPEFIEMISVRPLVGCGALELLEAT